MNLTKDLKKTTAKNDKASLTASEVTQGHRKGEYSKENLCIYNELFFKGWKQLFRFVTEAFSSKVTKIVLMTII